VELHIAGNPKMIVLAPTEEAVLGRRSPYGQLPDVDLSDYQAYILGVSRRHASIAVSQDGCTICDLGSANGTWINGERLRPHTPQPLKNGDEVRMGKLNIAIQIQAE
jgi:pSer/pThr/pTyr-binding forkhead associated (FHA) protein